MPTGHPRIRDSGLWIAGRFWPWPRSLGALESGREQLYRVVRSPVLVHELGDLFDCVENGSVISSAHAFPYFGQTRVGEFAGEVHDEMTGVYDRSGSFVANYLSAGNTREFSHGGDDHVGGYALAGRCRQVFEYLTREIDGERSPCERRERHYPCEAAL